MNYHKVENDTNLPNEVGVAGGRRTVLRSLAAGAIALPFAMLGYFFSKSPNSKYSKTILVGTVAELFGTKSRIVQTVEGQRVLFEQRDANVTAVLLRCTHAGCPLHVKSNGIACECHGGLFTFSGKPIQGPPKTPLTHLETTVVDGNVFIRLFERG